MTRDDALLLAAATILTSDHVTNTEEALDLARDIRDQIDELRPKMEGSFADGFSQA